MEQLMNVQGLTKSFKDHRVLKDVSFHVDQGEVLCILGPNGAGKGTTINILTAALGADSGEIRFQGTPYVRQQGSARLSQ